MTRHEATLVIRLVGHHDPHVEVVGQMIQVMMPGAVITVTDLHAAKWLYRAWVEAGVIARKMLRDRKAAPSYPEPHQMITSAVRITGRQPAPVVTGKLPAYSPSKRGQVVVRVGRLTIVCDDRGAWESQDRTWREMYEFAAQMWPHALSPEVLAELVQRQVNERLLHERRQSKE